MIHEKKLIIHLYIYITLFSFSGVRITVTHKINKKSYETNIHRIRHSFRGYLYISRLC